MQITYINKKRISCSALLLRHTDGPTPPTRRLRVLPTYAQAPEMAQTTMRTNLLQPLKVLTQFVVHGVGQHLRVLAVDDVALPVEEPGGDLVLGRALDDGHDALELFGRDFASAAVDVSA